MERQYGFRLLSVVIVILAGLLLLLGIIQFRWSLRVAQADEALSRQKLESGAFAFAQSFDAAMRRAMIQAEDSGRAALTGGDAPPLPPLISDLFYLGPGRVQRLDSFGIFQPIAIPAWAKATKCREPVFPAVPAVVIPVGDGACFLAAIDRKQFQLTLISDLLDRAFGSSVALYRFRVQDPDGAAPLFGSYFAPGIRQNLYDGAWEFDAAHRDPAIAAAGAGSRNRNLLFSFCIEALILIAVTYLLAGARSKLRIADSRVSFCGGLVREMRTPAEALATMLRQQTSGAHGENELTRHGGALMLLETDRIHAILERAMEYAGIHSLPRRPLEEVDMGRLITAALAEHYPALAVAGFDVEVAVSPSLPVVMGDPAALRTAFENLLINARKFSGTQRWIRVSADYVVETSEVQVSVQDRGLGIDAEEFEDIFEPFTRGRRAMAAQVSGAGLGLSLVRGAVEAHRGRVSVASEPNWGSTFTVHLPA